MTIHYFTLLQTHTIALAYISFYIALHYIAQRYVTSHYTCITSRYI